MKRRLWILWFCLSCTLWAESPEEFIPLTSTDGKTIEAKIIAATESEVEIELKNGNRFTLPHTRFSLTSREVIRKHNQKQEGGQLGRMVREKNNPEPVEPPFKFQGFSFRESETQHFGLYTLGTNAREVRGIAEKVFVLMMPRLPGIRDRFEKGEFRAPGEPANPADFPQGDGSFRYKIYLVSKQEEYLQMVEQYAESIESRNLKEFMLGTAPALGQFTDFKNRFAVAFDDGQTDIPGLVAHQIGFQLVGIETESQHLPLWLRMGSGYFAEHKTQQRCTVFYADFSAYEENRYQDEVTGEGTIDRKEVLSHNGSWIPAIQRLSRKEMPVSLTRMLAMDTENVTPVESAFSLALFSYCTSGVQEVKAFGKVLELIRKNEDPSAEEFATLFGFESVQAFDTAWQEFIQSRRFK